MALSPNEKALVDAGLRHIGKAIELIDALKTIKKREEQNNG